MSRIVYINGDFVDEQDAKISVFDRGFLFADGVYEVSSASTLVLPVISINGQNIGNGSPGELTKKMRDIYIQTALAL